LNHAKRIEQLIFKLHFQHEKEKRNAKVQPEKFDNPKDDSTIHTVARDSRPLASVLGKIYSRAKLYRSSRQTCTCEVADGARNHSRHLSKFGFVILIKTAATKHLRQTRLTKRRS